MKNSVKKSRIEFIGGMCLVLFLIMAYEIHLLPIGIWVGSEQTIYMANTWCVLWTIIGIYMALRLFVFSKIRKQLSDTNESNRLQAFVRWNRARTILLVFTLLINLFAYYATLETTGGLCAAMTFLAAFFCWPMDTISMMADAKKDDSL